MLRGRAIFAVVALVVPSLSQQSLNGKVCFITGGTSGLGEAAAEGAAKEGCSVVITGRREERGQAVVSKIKKAGGEAFFIKCDVMDPTQVEASVKAAINRYGSLDCAFNNAGMSSLSEAGGGPHVITIDDWKKTVDVNLNGVFYALKYQAAAMLAHTQHQWVHRQHRLDLLEGVAAPITAAYITTKHALVGLTKAAALAYAQNGIRVNNISPSFSPSELTTAAVQAEDMGVSTVSTWHPAGRWLKNREVVDGLLWLWSDKSSFYSGQDLVLDSGLTAQFVPVATMQSQLAAVGDALAKTATATAKAEL